jgi:hypothetical protein
MLPSYPGEWWGGVGGGGVLPHISAFPPNINPILHTAWLDNHALTLKSNSAK